MNELVVLVDENDKQTGLMPKMEAHEKGVLHRAVSVFIFNLKGEMLLQKRALDKYHSAGLWSNASCSHPKPGEAPGDAANRRLREEMGIDCDLHKIFTFVYKADLENNLTEYEYDHVFFGVTDAVPKPNPNEVADWKYMTEESLLAEIKYVPELYTEWFKICIKDYYKELFTTPGTAHLFL